MKKQGKRTTQMILCKSCDVDSLDIYSKQCETHAASSSGSGSGSGSFIWGSGKENCFFNCMACIGNSYDLDYSSVEYKKRYSDGSFWGRGGNVKTGEGGAPVAYYESSNGQAVPNPDTAAYINHFFNTKGSTWENNQSNIDNYLLKNKGENKGQVMAVIKTGEPFAHAVILDSTDGNYYYYIDPTTGERDVKISKDDVLYAIKIYGKK